MSDYPEHLLPKSDYCLIENSILESQKGLWLIRHIDSNSVKFLGKTKTLDPTCIQIQSDHLRDLSNNLLGVFQKSDVYYGIEKSYIGHYCDLWNGTEECVAPQIGHYFKDTDRAYYFLSVDDLLKGGIKIENVMDDTSENYHFKILHTPTRCNFWHISIRVYDDRNQEVSHLDISKKRKSRIWKTVRDYLITFVKQEVEGEYTILAPSIYRTNIQKS